MPSKSKSKANKGCVGIVSGGVLKVSTVYVFKNEDSEPENFASDLANYYGDAYEMKYVLVEDVDDVYEKFVEALDQNERVGTTSIFRVSVTDASKILKEVSEQKSCKTFSLKRKAKKDGSDGEQSDAEEEEKPKKKGKDSKDSKKAKKEESEDEQSEAEEEEKPKKKGKDSKDSKDSKKSKKQESDAEEDGSEKEEQSDDEDEGKKLKKKDKKADKKSEKSSKSKSK